MGCNDAGEFRGVNYFVSGGESDGGSDGVGNEMACSSCTQIDSAALRDELNEADLSGLAWTSPWLGFSEASYPCLGSIVFGREGVCSRLL